MKKKESEGGPDAALAAEAEGLSVHEKHRMRWSEVERKSRKQRRRIRGGDGDEAAGTPRRPGGGR